MEEQEASVPDDEMSMGQDVYTVFSDYTIEEQLAIIYNKIDNIQTSMLNIESLVSNVVTQVGPTIDAMSKHPMLKMIFGGK